MSHKPTIDTNFTAQTSFQPLSHSFGSNPLPSSTFGSQSFFDQFNANPKSLQNTFDSTNHATPNPHKSDQLSYMQPSMRSPKSRIEQELFQRKNLHDSPHFPQSKKEDPVTPSRVMRANKVKHLAELRINEPLERPVLVNQQFRSPQNNRISIPIQIQESIFTAQSVKSITNSTNFFRTNGGSIPQFNRETDQKKFIETLNQMPRNRVNNHAILVTETLNKELDVSFFRNPKGRESPKNNIRKEEEMDRKNRSKQILTNPKLLAHIIQFLEFDDLFRFKTIFHEFRNEEEHQKIIKQRLNHMMLNMNTKEDQYKFWNSIIDYKTVRQRNELAFTQHFVRKCEYIRDITKDLDRTFPDYEKFSTEKGKDGLLKVLVAISNTFKDVGYIQGLNSIAGVFLFYLKEEESFWSMVYLMEKLKIKNILKSDFEQVSLLNYQLESFITFYLPTISQHFEDQPSSLNSLTTQWFLTLFAYNLSIPNIAKVWNFMFIHGTPFLIQFALAIFSKYEKNLRNMSIDDVAPFIKDELQELDESDNSLFTMAVEFKVTKELLADLETHYTNGKPKVLLNFDKHDRGTWNDISQTESQSQQEIQKTPEVHIGRPRAESSKENNASKSSLPKEKQNQFFQNIVNTIKYDIPDTFKNMFAKKETKESLKIEYHKGFSEITTSSNQETQVSRSNSINLPEQANQKQSVGSRLIDAKSDGTPSQASPYTNHRAAENFDIFAKPVFNDSPSKETRIPTYGRPKIRPTNNSIDFSNMISMSVDKDLLRQVQDPLSYRYVENHVSPNTINDLSSIPELVKKSTSDLRIQMQQAEKNSNLNRYESPVEPILSFSSKFDELAGRTLMYPKYENKTTQNKTFL